MPRTKEEFDTWFRENAGDPWNYGGEFVQRRLDMSLAFMQRQTPAEFDGAIIEIGAFNGEFTHRLAKAFPASRVLANDISEVALDQAREKTRGLLNVAFDLSDLSIFETPQDLAGAPTVLTLLETLYYLHPHERSPALARLIDQTHRPVTYISGPVQGEQYFTESELRAEFAHLGYSATNVMALNATDDFRTLLHEASPEASKQLLRRLDDDMDYRARYARQVIFRFEPTEGP